MPPERVLITGCAGIVGRILLKFLADDYELWGIDARPIADESRFKRADLSELLGLKRLFSSLPPFFAAIHLAGDSRVDAPWESVLKHNIIGTHNLYECARIHGIRRVILASSNHVTGAYEGVPRSLHLQHHPLLIRPDDPIRPDSDYGAGKAWAEALALVYYELHGLSSICLRIGSVLPDDDPRCYPRTMKTWLSHRDLTQLVRKSLQSSIGYGIYYGVSDNLGRFWDISNARSELGYNPQDDASRLFPE